MKQLLYSESNGKESSRMSKVKMPQTSTEDQKKIKMELPVNVFCSICNQVFDFVTDLQTHLSDHLHLDKERRITIEKLQGLSKEEWKNNHNACENSMKAEGDTGFDEDQETMEIPEAFGHDRDEDMGEVLEITPEIQILGQPSEQRMGGYFTPELESALLAHYSDHFPSLWIALSESRENRVVNQYYNGNNGDEAVSINENMDSIDSAISTERIESASTSEEEDDEEEEEEQQQIQRQPVIGTFVCPSCSLRFPSLNGCSAHLLTGSCLKNCILEEKPPADDVSFMPQITYQCPCCQKQFLNMRSFGTHCYNHILECSKPAAPNHSIGNNKVKQGPVQNRIPEPSHRIIQPPPARLNHPPPARIIQPPPARIIPAPRPPLPTQNVPPSHIALPNPPRNKLTPPTPRLVTPPRAPPPKAPPSRAPPSRTVLPPKAPPQKPLPSKAAPPPRAPPLPKIAPPPVVSTPPPIAPANSVVAVENSMTEDAAVRVDESPGRVTRKSMRLKLKLHEKKSIVLTPSEVKSAMLKPPLTNPNSFAFKEPDILSCATCDETFENADSCCAHLRYLNDKPFICTHCGKLFRFEEARDVHQEQPHIIPCSRCIVDVYFVSNSCLLLHCRHYHSSND